MVHRSLNQDCFLEKEMNKVIITVAPTGNVPTKQLNPNTPITPDEIAEDIYQCYQEGAAIAHIHARDENGEPTGNIEIFREIMQRVKQKCDIIIQLSTGARGGKTYEERGACLDLKPEMASLTTGSSNFTTQVNSNPSDFIQYLAKKMLANNIKPEIEAFDVAMISNAEFLMEKVLLKKPVQFNLVMGVPGSITATPKNLFHMLELLPKETTWSVLGAGKAHLQIIGLGIVLGGNIRVGLEDVLEMSQGIPASNVELVKRAVNLAKAYGRTPATSQEARKMLGIIS
jgi:3-keto-5-aminohexanoate cleavage enzyme